MTEFEQIKTYIEQRKKDHFDMLNHQYDSSIMSQLHEDDMILNEIEKIISKHDTIKSDK